MELLYLWVGNYKNIKEQAINIYNLDISFDKEKGKINIKTPKNEVLKKLKFNNDFFSKSKSGKIKNITAIIGKNGSGKSSIIEFLLEIFSKERVESNYRENLKGKKLNKILNYFLITLENEEFIIYTDIDNLKEKNNNKIIDVYSIENAIHREFGPGRIIKKNTDIFYTTSFDSGNAEIDISNGSFISNTSITGKKVDKYNGIRGEDNALGRMKITDYKYIAKFIYLNYAFLNNFSKKLKINIPTKIVFTSKIFLPNYKKGEEVKDGGRFNKVIEEALKNLSLNSIEQYILFYFCRRATETYVSFHKEKINEVVQNTLDKFISNAPKNFNEIFNEIIIECSSLDNGNNFIHPPIKSILDDLKDQLIYFWIISKKEKIKPANNRTIFSYEINLGDWEKLESFLENMPLSVIEEFFNVSYGKKLSRGEENLLILLSRLFEKLGEHRSNKENNSKEYIFYIDEGEDGFHPEWQRRYISTLIEILDVVLEKNEKVQIFITSHSPFIVSDLPSDNVIFLDIFNKDDREVLNDTQKINNCKVIGSEKKGKTFASNIHTLLKNGFFLESTIGEFAKNKIKNIINEISILSEKKEIEEEKKRELENVIELIGEPIIRLKLKEKLTTVINEKENEVDLLKQLYHQLSVEDKKSFHEKIGVLK